MSKWEKDESVALHKPLCAKCKHFTGKKTKLGFFSEKYDEMRKDERKCEKRGRVHPNYGCIEFVTK